MMSVSSADEGGAMTRGLALIACAALAACATTDEPQIASAGEQRCVREARIGSSIPATKCYDRVTTEQHKREVDYIADQIRRAPGRSTSSTAGSGS
jgi:hypothetical protein